MLVMKNILQLKINTKHDISAMFHVFNQHFISKLKSYSLILHDNENPETFKAAILLKCPKGKTKENFLFFLQ